VKITIRCHNTEDRDLKRVYSFALNLCMCVCVCVCVCVCMCIVKFPLCLTKHHVMKKYWGSGGIAQRILDLGARWNWVVSFTPRSLYSQGKSPRYPLDRSLGGPQSRSGRGLHIVVTHSTITTKKYVSIDLETYRTSITYSLGGSTINVAHISFISTAAMLVLLK
jgi:hypothetical protein